LAGREGPFVIRWGGGWERRGVGLGGALGGAGGGAGGVALPPPLPAGRRSSLPAGVEPLSGGEPGLAARGPPVRRPRAALENRRRRRSGRSLHRRREFFPARRLVEGSGQASG